MIIRNFANKNKTQKIILIEDGEINSVKKQ